MVTGVQTCALPIWRHQDAGGDTRPRKLRDVELHPEKTKVVYCKDDDRRRTYPNEKFDFLGYTFRPRRSKNRKGRYFVNFSPAVSDKAVKAIRAEIRHWNLHLRSDKSIEDLSVAVGTAIADRPPHRPVLALLTHTVPASDMGMLGVKACVGIGMQNLDRW